MMLQLPRMVAVVMALVACPNTAERLKFSNMFTARLPLVPYPAEVKMGQLGAKPFELRKDSAISVGEGIPEDHLSVVNLRALKAAAGKAGQGAGISLKLVQGAEAGSAAAEGYRLHISDGGVELESPSLAGLFYGVQTMKQLATQGKGSSAHWPAAVIKDAPRFVWRGMHLDVSRHFFSAIEVKRLLDVMALYKLNHFHWHLTDDQGWRLPVDGYPELLTVGAHNKAYTKDEVKDVVAYAAARHIEVVPEVDVPGHVEAALAAYPDLGNLDVEGREAPKTPRMQWGVSMYTLAPSNATWQFLGKVYDSLAELFPASVVHIGGDEVMKTEWGQSKAAKVLLQTGEAARLLQTGEASSAEEANMAPQDKVAKLFARKINQLLVKRGRRVAAWDEAQHEEGFPSDGIVMAWRDAGEAELAAQAGRQVVVADQAKLYFDHAQAKDNEPASFGYCSSLANVYGYDPMPQNLTQTQQKLVLGAQAQLWSEYFPKWDHVEYMAHPRSLALAERLWTPTSNIQGMSEFSGRLAQRLWDLEHLGVNYRRVSKGGGC